MTVRVIDHGESEEIEYDPENPPDVFFDTNVWHSMNDKNIVSLQQLQRQHGFRYRYTTINFIELASHLDDEASKACQNPFNKFQSCFRRIHKICDRDILRSPENVFLARAGLSHYIHPAWIADVHQMALAIETIINATSLAELTGEEAGNETTNLPRYIVRPSHHRGLRNTDGQSMRAIMGELEGFKRPITVDDKLVNWFVKLCHFFLFVRPTNGMFLQKLAREEQNKFGRSLTEGGGKIFHDHCMFLVKRTVNDGRKVYPNDLYDMLQLILLEDGNALFVTSEKAFLKYNVPTSEPKRVIYWNNFVTSA